MPKKIGIIDADLLDKGTRHPNLALMKISGYHKELHDDVTLLTTYDNLSAYDKIYVSKVFSFTKVPELVKYLPNVVIGGTGFFEDGGADLPSEIEHHMPDYSLYNDYVEDMIAQGHSRTRYLDYLEYSIGFTTRGCFRKCPFCVNKKYNHPFKHSPIQEFVDESRPFIYLWDDNFLAFPGWEEILDELEATNKPFQFRQGLDIRLVDTDAKAARLSKTHYHGDFIFAFDHIGQRKLIENCLTIWRRHTSKTTKLYVLCGFASQDIKDVVSTFERIRILMSYGCLPYIMRHENYKKSEFRSLYTQLARWCNQPQFFKKKSFRQFCEANQAAHQNPNTTCAAYQTMLDFEKKYPDIAKKYFDLRFDQENRYSVNYGYGRKYSHKRDCASCQQEQTDWSSAYLGKKDLLNIFRQYFSLELDLQCLTYIDSQCKKRVEPSKIAEWFCNKILNDLSWGHLLDIINNRINPAKISQENIPQFSDIEDAIIGVPYHIYSGKKDLSYVDLGYRLDNGKSKNDTAKRKYGENHAKFATLLDLVTISTVDNNYLIKPSIFGLAYKNLSDGDKKKIIAKLMFRIPIIQELFRDAQNGVVYIDDYLTTLSASTQTRRKSNIMSLINYIRVYSSPTSKIHSLSYNIMEKRKISKGSDE